MQINPYLFFDSNCEAAFKFYEKVLGGKIELMLRNSEGPPEMGTAPDRKQKIMHARMSIDGEVIMASDAPPSHFQKPQGFAVSITVNDPAEAERKFKALCEGGSDQHAVQQDLLLEGLWHGRRPVRHSLDGELPAGRLREES